MADPEGAVLLVRGALADGDQARAVALAKQTQRLAAMTPGDPDMAAAADRARGLVERDPAALQRAAGRYAPGLARAGALEDAGNSWAGRGDPGRATTLLSQAYALYEETPTTWPGSGPARGPPAPGSGTGVTRTARPSAGTA